MKDMERISHSEPHYPGNPCSPSCTGYAPTQARIKEQRKLRAASARKNKSGGNNVHQGKTRGL